MDIDRLLDVMQRLRDPETGCAWDLEQNFKSIAPYTLEEAYEVVDAIERQDLADLKDELGDLLLQVVFHSQMASEQHAFDFADVVGSIVSKMIRRHPHVFGETRFASTEEMKTSWEATKERERAEKRKALQAGDAAPTPPQGSIKRSGDEPVAEPMLDSALDGIARALPALKRADKIQKRAARVGFDWSEVGPVFEKIDEEVGEVRAAVATGKRSDIEDELGDLLFSVVNLTRFYEVDAETALARANEKFSARFRLVEQLANQQGAPMSTLSLDELDALWEAAKTLASDG